MNDKHRILSTVCIYHAFNDATVVAIPLLFPIFKEIFNLSYTQIGVITGGGLLITFFAQLMIGRISDQKDFRMLLSVGVLLLCVSLLLFTQTQGFLTLLLFILILRFSSSFFHPTGIGWISRTFKKDRLDWVMGIQSASGDFGAFIAILTTLYIAELKGWSFPFYIWAVIGAICLFIGIYLTKNTDKKYLEITNNNYKRQTIKEAVSEAKEILKHIKLLIPAFIISGSAWGITVSYLPLLLDERTTLPLTLIGLVVSVWIGIGTIACLFYGKIQSYIGRKTIVIFSYLAMGVAGFALCVFTNVYVILAIMVLLGVSTFLSFPALFSFVSEITHKTIEGRTFGYLFTLQLGGGTVMLFLSGAFSDIWGIWMPFFLLGVVSIVFFFLLMINVKKDFVEKPNSGQ